MTLHRVGIISRHPAPYRDPTYSRVAKNGQLDLEVLNLSNISYSHEYWNLSEPDYPVIGVGTRHRIGSRKYLYLQLINTIRKRRYDALLIPGIELTMFLSHLFCKITNTPFIYCCDTISRPWLPIQKRIARNIRDCILGKNANAILVPGTAGRDYFERLSIPTDRIFEGAYQLDTEEIVRSIAQVRPRREELRKEYGIHDDCFVFIMVANIKPSRRHDILIKAFSRVSYRSHVRLFLIGDGIGRKRLEAMCKSANLDNITFVNGIPFRDLCNWYVLADAYIHSGFEPYSTSLAYGAIAGCPIIASNAIGAAKDYVIDGTTGYLCDPLDTHSFMLNINKLLDNPNDAKRIGEKAEKLARQRTTKWAAEQLERAFFTAINH